MREILLCVRVMWMRVCTVHNKTQDRHIQGNCKEIQGTVTYSRRFVDRILNTSFCVFLIKRIKRELRRELIHLYTSITLLCGDQESPVGTDGGKTR